MQIETRRNVASNKVRMWCGACSKELFNEDYGMEVFAPGIIDLMESRAIRHEQKHPKHSPLIIIYQRLPTNAEIRSGK